MRAFSVTLPACVNICISNWIMLCASSAWTWEPALMRETYRRPQSWSCMLFAFSGLPACPLKDPSRVCRTGTSKSKMIAFELEQAFYTIDVIVM